MKGFYKIIVLLLIMLLSFPAMVGCGAKNDTQESTSIVIKGFNDYYGCVATLWGNVFGRGEVNNDKKFITEGEGSLHLLVQGEYGKTNYYPNIRFGNDMFEQDKPNDFSEFKNISLDCYNDTGKELHIMVHLTVVGTDGADCDIPTQTYTLKPQSWTTVCYDFSDGSIHKAFNDLQNVKELVLEFPEYKSQKDDECSSIYIDNFSAVKGEHKDYVQTVENGQILSFDSIKQINQFNTRNFASNYIYNNVLLSLNTNKAYVSQGDYSMKAQVFANVSTYLSLILNSFGDDYLSSFTTASIDVFNASDVKTTIWIDYSTDMIATTTVRVDIEANSMSTIEFNIPESKIFNEFKICFSPVSSNHTINTFYFDNFMGR